MDRHALNVFARSWWFGSARSSGSTATTTSPSASATPAATLWITRKGAIKADVGDLGVIPGSMGTRSYIVAGKGNPASYNSCSHGAGRPDEPDAGQAEPFTARLAARGHGRPGLATARPTALVDEHPGFYKDIDQVMADQADLVGSLHTLRQVLNYKGF